MSWFNRKKNPYNNVTNDYLQATDTVSRPLSVIFVILMIFVIAAVVFSLFLGGRWLYQNLDGKSTSTTEVITGQVPSTNTESGSSSTSNSGTASTSTSPANTSTTNTSSTNQSSAVTSTPATPAPATTTSTSIPNTGPEPE